MKPKKVRPMKRAASPEVRAHVEDLAADASTEENVGAFMDPASKGDRKKRGPYKKRNKENSEETTATSSEAETQNLAAEIDKLKPLVRPLWETISTVGVKIAETPDAAIGPNEMVVLVDCSAACVLQYLPGLLGTHASLIVLSLTFGQWASRVYILRQMQLDKLRREINPSGMPDVEMHTGNPADMRGAL